MGYTFTMIKPKVVANGLSGDVLSKIEHSGFRVVAMKKVWMTPTLAAGFYKEHIGRPFFEELVNFMISGPVVAMILEKEGDTIVDYRTLVGNTDPALAAEGTIRKEFAESKTVNAVHGADSVESFEREWPFFFTKQDWC